MIEYLWIIAGAIIGWVGIDLFVGAIKKTCPTPYQVAMAFVGALTAYTLAF